MKDIAACGIDCAECADYIQRCEGCSTLKGIPYWYKEYNVEGICSFYECIIDKGLKDCSSCNSVPCDKFFSYPDPGMIDEEKQKWLDHRIKNLKELNAEIDIVLAETFEENEKTWNKKKK